MSNSFLYDGFDRLLPHQSGPIRGWTDPITRSRKYALPLRVPEDGFYGAGFSTGGPLGGFLISESEPRHLGAGLLEYEQIYALVPAPRVVPETITFPVQLITGADLGELPLTSVAQVTYDYLYDPSGTVMEPFRTYRVVKVGTTFYYLGTPISLDGLFVAEDSKIRNWAGFIQERRTARITPQSLTAVPP